MSRAVDEPYFQYSVNSAMESGIQVKCSKCKVRFTKLPSHFYTQLTSMMEENRTLVLSCGF